MWFVHDAGEGGGEVGADLAEGVVERWGGGGVIVFDVGCVCGCFCVVDACLVGVGMGTWCSVVVVGGGGGGGAVSSVSIPLQLGF